MSCALLQSYLQGRTQVVRIGGGVSNAERIDIGVPQGSILGPLLFLIYINDLPDQVLGTSFTLFADDTSLLNRGPVLADVLSESGLARSSCLSWFNANMLCMNAEKTQELVFSLRDTGEINGMEHVDFLGVRLDHRLNWECHVDQLSRKLSRNVYVLRSLSLCVSRSALRTVYHALCQSLMSYAMLVWGHAASATRIFCLQRRAIRIVCGLGYRDCCRQAFIESKILTFPCLYVYKCLLYVKKHETTFVKYCDVHNYDTRNNQLFVSDFHRLKKGHGNCRYQGIKMYNKIPLHIRSLPFAKFENKIKQILLDNAFYSVSEYLDYVF